MKTNYEIKFPINPISIDEIKKKSFQTRKQCQPTKHVNRFMNFIKFNNIFFETISFNYMRKKIIKNSSSIKKKKLR